MMQSFRLPWPPSVNMYWRHIVLKGQARVLISQGGREYRTAVAKHVQQQCVLPIGDAPFEILLIAHPPDNLRRDLDNLPKGILDSMQRANVYTDDFQMQRLEVQRGATCKGNGHILVSLTALKHIEQTRLKLA